jgi:hypothetical protein
MNPINTIFSFFTICFNITFQSTPKTSKRSPVSVTEQIIFRTLQCLLHDHPMCLCALRDIRIAGRKTLMCLTETLPSEGMGSIQVIQDKIKCLISGQDLRTPYTQTVCRDKYAPMVNFNYSKTVFLLNNTHNIIIQFVPHRKYITSPLQSQTG